MTYYYGFSQTITDAWINEIHYSNIGADNGEAVEIVIADISTYPLANWSIVPYNGNNGNPYSPVGDFTIPDAQSTNNSFTIAAININSLQNGSPDGLALVYNGSIVVQFLSYEGTFTANSGVASGLTSEDIGVEESDNSPEGQSLQLGGTGSAYSDFSWQTVTSFTFGSINNNQTLENNCSIPSNIFGLTATPGNLQVDLNWTNSSCFDEILVIAKEGSLVTAVPSGDGTSYVANSTFASGTDLGSGEYTVFKGIGTSVTVTGLTNGTTYHFEVFVRKGTSWSSGVTDNATPSNVQTTGSIIITEIMQNPAAVSDPNGEYFEVYNASSNPIDMNGWIISDSDNDNHTINSPLIVPAYGFAILGTNIDSSNNGGVTVDYEYPNSFQLANNMDEIILTDSNSNEIDRVEYNETTNWPDPNGAAMIYTGSDIENNNDGSLWIAATVSEGLSPDFGSPGINGTDQIVSYLVFSGNAWNSVPTNSTGSRNALIRSLETTSFDSNISVNDLFIEEGANLTVTSGHTLSTNSVTLESTSTQYSSLIVEGAITGIINYKRHINIAAGSGAPTGDNDLISAPVTNAGQTFLAFRTVNSNILSGNINGVPSFLFGPFDNTNNIYVNYNASNDGDVLAPGVGYRTGSTDNGTYTFTGDVELGEVNVPIDVNTSKWNLIGNPYPSYISAAEFLTANAAVLDENAVGIYGYDGSASDGWTVINFNNLNTSTNITPGQGFLVASETPEGIITFTPSMRTTGTDDDFIIGRLSNDNTNKHLKLKINSSNNTYETDFYFNDNSSLGLDPGYDAMLFRNNPPGFSIYSQLIEENADKAIAIQSLDSESLNNISIPLGINISQGVQVTIGISESNIPTNIDIYLEDSGTNTFTLLNTNNYIFTTDSNVSGTGRFFLHFNNNSLTLNDEMKLNNVEIYTLNSSQSIVIEGLLYSETTLKLHDIQGREVLSKPLKQNRNKQIIGIANLNSGIYVAKLENNKHSRIQKIIIN